MNNTLEYVTLVVIALVVGFWASNELYALLVDAVDQTARMITGGY